MKKSGIRDMHEISRRNFLRQSTVFGAATVAGMMLPWRSIAALADGFPVTDTIYGKIRGMEIQGIKTFLGIRYGQSTAGANRFMPPVRPKK